MMKRKIAVSSWADQGGLQISRWGVYKLIAESLRGRISSGEFAPGSLLPSEAELTAQYRVSRGTLRRSLAELEGAGLVKVRPGRRRVVMSPDAAVLLDRGNMAGYQQIARDLRIRIEDGGLRPDEQLPSESELMMQYGVSRGTARQAFLELQSAGLVAAVQGKGRFVRAGSGQDV